MNVNTMNVNTLASKIPLVLISVGFLALAVGMLSYRLLDGLVGAVTWLVRRRSTRGPRLAEYLSALGGAVKRVDTLKGIFDNDEAETGTVPGTGKRSPLAVLLPWLPMVAGLIAAAIAWDWLLSPWLVLLGYLIFRGLSSGQRQATGKAVGEDLERLLNSFRSIWSVQESLFGALDEAAADLEPGPAQRAVYRAVARSRTGMKVGEALSPLRTLPSAAARQVAYVLGQLPATDEATGRRVLDELEERLRRARRLRQRAATVLILTRLTLRVLQVANGVAVLVALTMPLWMDFFTVSISHRMTFIAATSMVAGGSAYFAGETQRLEASL